MNGTAYSNFDNQEHVLKLGETFEKHPKSAYHTVRCKWWFHSFGFAIANRSMLVSSLAEDPKTAVWCVASLAASSVRSCRLTGETCL